MTTNVMSLTGVSGLCINKSILNRNVIDGGILSPLRFNISKSSPLVKTRHKLLINSIISLFVLILPGLKIQLLSPKRGKSKSLFFRFTNADIVRFIANMINRMFLIARIRSVKSKLMYTVKCAFTPSVYFDCTALLLIFFKNPSESFQYLYHNTLNNSIYQS